MNINRLKYYREIVTLLSTKRFITKYIRLQSLIVAIAVMPLFVSLTVNAGEFRVFTEQMPPYNYSNKKGVAVGFCSEIVREMFNRTDLTITNDISLIPWARAYNFLENQKDTMLFSMTRSDEREKKFQWVGPLAHRTIWLWKLASRDDIQATNLTTAKKYTVGGVYEFASSEYLQEQGFKVDMVSSIDQNWKKLLLNRIDLVSALELEAAYSMQQLDRTFKDLEKVTVLDDRYEYYLAININSDISIAKKLQAALDQMKADGTYEKIRNKYLR